MNEMYTMSLSLHSFGTVALLGVICLNILFLLLANDLYAYKRKMSIVLMPLSSMALGTVVFTGVVMMAAKHLEFNLANIVMILLSLILIFLEAKRSKTLKLIRVDTEMDALEAYKKFASAILMMELLLITLIAAWMWLK